MFTEDQREQAALIGHLEVGVSEKVSEIFRTLPDPLLSAEDVSELLVEVAAAEVHAALADLDSAGVVEFSETTQRPFDPIGIRLYRLANQEFERLLLVALEAQLVDGSSRYQFTCDGRLIRCIAEVDRLNADTDAGQQRAEIRKHVEDIRDGIKEGTQIPNSILLSLIEEKMSTTEDGDGEDDDDVPESWTRIRPMSEWLTMPVPGQPDIEVQRVRLVELNFPFRRAAFDEEKTALLIDGQQRTAAIALVGIDAVPQVDLSVNAIVTDKDGAKLFFHVANNAKPIPNEFKLSLLAAMGNAPGFLQDERVRASATRLLAIIDQTSPFYHRVRYPGFLPPPQISTPIVYNSLFNVVKAFESTTLPGRDTAEGLAGLVRDSFVRVKNVWPEEWQKRPQETKLTAGVGLRALAELLAWWLQVEVGIDAKEITEDDWQKMDWLLGELRNRVAWSGAGAATSTGTAATFFMGIVQEKQNTNQDVKKLLHALQDVVQQITKTAKDESKKKSK